MAVLKATRGAQYPLNARFKFNIADTMLNTSAVSTAFKAASGTVFDVINLPNNAIITGGSIHVTTVSNDSSTATMSVGDSGSATRYLGATSIKSAARTAIVPTGYLGAGEQIRITLANATGDATTGDVEVEIMFIIQDRMNEAYPN